MKKIVSVMMTLALLMLPAALAEEAPEAEMPIIGMPNPWVETTLDEMTEGEDVKIAIPGGAENVACLEETFSDMKEMVFTLDGNDFIFRFIDAEEFVDISGMYYDPWDSEEAFTLDNGVTGTIRATEIEGGAAIDCLWFDEELQTMFSLAVVTNDGAGVDILDVLSMVLPFEDDVNDTHLTADMDWFRIEDETVACVSLPIYEAEDGMCAWSCEISEPDMLNVIYEENGQNPDDLTSWYSASFEGVGNTGDVTITLTEKDPAGNVQQTRTIGLWINEANVVSLISLDVGVAD